MNTSKETSIVCLNIADISSNVISVEKIRDRITIYYFSHKNLNSFINNFSEVLSHEEKDRAKTFHFIDDTNNFIVCHGVLRFLLSKELNKKPQDLCFLKGLNDKPFLEGNELYFNISHTKELCAIAISENFEVGIDIEKIKVNTDYAGISKSYFSEEEQMKINNSENPLESFFLFWTRKEAFLKVVGLGLNTNLKEIRVSENTNLINCSRLFEYQKAAIDKSYFIYSKQINNHSLSIATPLQCGIELIHLSQNQFYEKFNNFISVC